MSQTTLGDDAVWTFAPTLPLAPYLFSVCAGPHRLGHQLSATAGRREVPVEIFAPGLVPGREVTQQIVELVGRFMGFYERIFAMPYPYPKFDAVFVPGFSALAYSPPGLAILRDTILTATHEQALYLPCVIAHEVAHSWIGGLLDCVGAAASIAAAFVTAQLVLQAQLGYTLSPPGLSYAVAVVSGLLISLLIVASALPLLTRITGPDTARND